MEEEEDKIREVGHEGDARAIVKEVGEEVNGGKQQKNTKMDPNDVEEDG